MSDKITIKGTSDGLTITVGSGHWDNILARLEAELAQKATFFYSVISSFFDNTQLELIAWILCHIWISF